MMTVTNTARLYVYDSEFADQSRERNANEGSATLLRDYMQTYLRWAQQATQSYSR